MHACINIFTETLCTGRMRYKGNIFQQSLTGLNSEFSFSNSDCHIEIKELNYP